MKRVLVLMAALIAACCGETSAGKAPPHRVGATNTFGTVGTAGWLVTVPTITGNNATIILYDQTNGDTVRRSELWPQRIVGSLRCDQAVTLLYQIKHTGSSTWRTMNGNGSGDAVSANTDTVIDFLVLGPDSRVAVTTGGTGPSACEVDVGLFAERGVGL